MAFEKREGPATCLSFLGLELDTVAMVLRLPASKLEALQVLIRSWLPSRLLQARSRVIDRLTLPRLLCGAGRENLPAQVV